MDQGAIVDILENPRYEGAITTIKSVTDIVDTGFMTVITFLAFFIISVALLRNVFAGVYCAFPKFWDEVARAHKDNQDKAFFQSITNIKESYKTASMGSIKTFIMRILPNIKVLTDFDTEDSDAPAITPKAYFIKAIPQMIAVVIIGVFIYNGYYRDATALVAGTGAELLERTLLSFDPVAVFDTIANTAGRPSFATDNALTTGGKLRNKVTVDVYSAIISHYEDIRTADDKAILAGTIDSAMTSVLGTDTSGGLKDVGTYLNSDKYNITTKVEFTKDFDQSSYTNLEDKDKKQWCFKITVGHDQASSVASDASILFDSTAPAYKQDWFIRILVLATRIADQGSANAITGATLYISSSEANTYYPGLSMSSGSPIPTKDGKYEIRLGGSVSEGSYNYIAAISDSEQTPTSGTFELNSPIKATATTDKGKKVSISFTQVMISDTPGWEIGESEIYTNPSVDASGNFTIGTKETDAEAEGDSTGDSTAEEGNEGPIGQ